MYTIKEAAARAGVSVQVVRAWERRYGVVEPTRSAAGYRLYDEAAIDRLRAMTRLIDDGWAPSTAARHIRELDDDTIRETAEGSASTPEITTARPAQVLTEAFVRSAAALDEQGFESVLDEMFASGSFEQVASQLVMPALVAVGDGWATGKLDVASEHAAAAAVQRRLGMAFFAAGVPKDDDIVLVGLPPGTRHDLGALAFATAARRAGVTIRYLGADLPVADWLDAVARTRARGVVIGVIMDDDIQSAINVARSIRAKHANVLLAFGGRASASLATTGLEPAITLPDDLTGAVRALRAELGA